MQADEVAGTDAERTADRVAQILDQLPTLRDFSEDLQRLQKALNTMVGQCKGSAYTIDDCPIIDALYVE